MTAHHRAAAPAFLLLLCAAMPTTAASAGDTLAFALRAGNENHVAVMNTDGSGVTDLANCGVGECSPSWSPDGSQIAFERHDNNGAGIYVMNADGSNQRRLSPIPGFDVRPSWSPNGASIIFNRVVGAGQNGVPSTDIMTMSAADGSNRRTVLAGKGTFNIEPRISPDSAKIAFMSNRQGGQHIYTANANGSSVKRITNRGSNGDPSWSPDGSRIAFGSNREGGGRLNLFTAKPDGSDVRQLTWFDPPGEAGDTSWSPDGSQIAFEVDAGGNGQSDPNVPAEIWIVPSDGSGPPVSTHQACAAVGCAPRFRPQP